MGCVQQAVHEFDEEVRAPWRPLLVNGSSAPGAAPAVEVRHHPARPGASRVGVCRPSAASGRRRPGALSRPVRAGGGGVRSIQEAPPAAPAGARNGRRRTAVRFTRRAHRLAIALALCGGVVAGALLGQLVPDGGEPALRLVGVSSVVVDPGDTLWSIATSVSAGEDVRVVVDRIQELNGLDGAELTPGQVLLLP